MKPEKKYTQGPWKFVIDDDGDKIIMDGNGVAFQVDTDYYPFNSHNVNDWHLQASAPDLLEALEEVVRISDRNHVAWDKAKEAINKAYGL